MRMTTVQYDCAVWFATVNYGVPNALRYGVTVQYGADALIYGVPLRYDVPWCGMMYHGVVRCTMVGYGVPWCGTMYHGAVWCAMV